MNTKNTPHKWHLLVYFVSKHVTIIVVTIKLFPLINFLLSQLKYLTRLTYTLLVISLHKINMLVSFLAPLNTYRSSERQQIFLQRRWQGGQSDFDALAACGVNAQLEIPEVAAGGRCTEACEL